MPFGLSFGMNHSNSRSTTNVDRTDTTNQNTTGAQSTSGTTTNTATGSTNTTQSGTSGTTTAGTTTGTTTGSQASTQTQQLFGDSVLGGLEGAVGQLLGAIPTTPSSLNDNFDSNAFINSGMDAASSRVNSDLDTSLNSMYDQFGGRDDSNSMVALLANRARGDAGAQLAGTRAQLEAQAQGVERDRFLANLQGQSTSQNYLNTVLSSLRGGRATTTGNVETAEQQAQQQTGTSNTATTQTGSENTQSNSTSTQQLLELLSQIVNGTTHTVGTETNHTRGTNIGGGASLSL